MNKKTISSFRSYCHSCPAYMRLMAKLEAFEQQHPKAFKCIACGFASPRFAKIGELMGEFNRLTRLLRWDYEQALSYIKRANRIFASACYDGLVKIYYCIAREHGVVFCTAVNFFGRRVVDALLVNGLCIYDRFSHKIISARGLGV